MSERVPSSCRSKSADESSSVKKTGFSALKRMCAKFVQFLKASSSMIFIEEGSTSVERFLQ